MATFALTDQFISFNSVDLSEWVKSASLTENVNLLDDTAMGDTSVSRVAGLKSWSVSITFNADFAAGAVDATIGGVGVGGSAAFITRPTSAAVAATNPQYAGTAFVASYVPLSNSVGDLAGATVTLEGTGALARTT